MPDTYTIYTQWWSDHYGYACPITREAWERYLSTPRRSTVQSDTQFDHDTERHEGWANG
jgi:hypothetical protein